MANISNVKLDISQVPGQPKQKKVTVSYQIRFNSAEELAGSVFKESVTIRGNDVGPDQHLFRLKSLFVKAQPGVLNRSFSKNVHREKLDEDDDFGFFGVKISFQDEVYANVCLEPFNPQGDSSNSNEIVRFF
ncbi:hypothetical protein [Lacihabitans soyangensis]|uniref:Uncharacterized protein n=1 Tax=Lacihabitans soyangensis TaxID=869394 RepID=A0AAE3KWN9_9BACT|nr:hypothetical protein [Lacihabitans soyangensis]MCP9766041.1 hypothetical protein [Lacihabitans soyangensis]